MAQDRKSGKIKFFNTLKGFGFIAQDDGSGKDIFLHATNFQGDPNSLNENDRIEFEVAQGKKGPEAVNARKG